MTSMHWSVFILNFQHLVQKAKGELSTIFFDKKQIISLQIIGGGGWGIGPRPTQWYGPYNVIFELLIFVYWPIFYLKKPVFGPKNVF